MTDLSVTIDTAAGPLHGTITGLPETLTGTDFVRVAFMAQAIADAANAAYWLEAHSEYATNYQRRIFLEKFEELRDLIEGRA